MHQMLSLGFFLILVNNPKQPLLARIIKKPLKVNFILFFEPSPFNGQDLLKTKGAWN